MIFADMKNIASDFDQIDTALNGALILSDTITLDKIGLEHGTVTDYTVEASNNIVQMVSKLAFNANIEEQTISSTSLQVGIERKENILSKVIRNVKIFLKKLFIRAKQIFKVVAADVHKLTTNFSKLIECINELKSASINLESNKQLQKTLVDILVPTREQLEEGIFGALGRYTDKLAIDSGTNMTGVIGKIRKDIIFPYGDARINRDVRLDNDMLDKLLKTTLKDNNLLIDTKDIRRALVSTTPNDTLIYIAYYNNSEDQVLKFKDLKVEQGEKIYTFTDTVTSDMLKDFVKDKDIFLEDRIVKASSGDMMITANEYIDKLNDTSSKYNINKTKAVAGLYNMALKATFRNLSSIMISRKRLYKAISVLVKELEKEASS